MIDYQYQTCPTCGVMLPRVVHGGTTLPCAEYIQVGPVTPQPPSVTTVYIPPCPRCAELEAEIATLRQRLEETPMDIAGPCHCATSPEPHRDHPNLCRTCEHQRQPRYNHEPKWCGLVTSATALEHDMPVYCATLNFGCNAHQEKA